MPTENELVDIIAAGDEPEEDKKGDKGCGEEGRDAVSGQVK